MALSACDSSSLLDVSIAGDSPGVASVAVTDVVDGEASVDWNLTSGAFAEQWNLYQNNLRVCSGTPLTVAASGDSPSYQTGGCTIALQEGSNSFQVQLCNADSSQCSSSATEVIDYQEPTELGAIAWQDLPDSETTENQHYLSWSKGEGINGDYWHIYQDDAVACSGTLSYSSALGAQSAGCDVTLYMGANSFQAQLCQTQPVGIGDNCVQSPVVSLSFSTDPERILATPVIAELDESLPANYDTAISWSKDTSSGSAGEDWSLFHNGVILCQGTLAGDADGASCTINLAEGANNLQVQLCTAVETYSGASCAYSATVAVDGFDPEPLTPGTITISDSLPAQISDTPSVVVDWQIASGNGVSSWSVYGNDALYCDTANADEYYWSGSCPIALESGFNTISVTGCNYGYADSESCTTSSEVEVEYITVPGTPELTTSLPATTYLSEHNLSWELTEGEAADYWLAMVNDISQCSDDLAQLTPQSGSCIVELDSGINSITVRLCIANESGSAYCSDSEAEQVELLAPVPAQPEIATPEQSIADDIILLEWSKSGGDNGSYWSLSNNGALVAACADQPLLSSGSSQSGSCNLPLELGANLISVSLCNDNSAGTISCSTSESISITRVAAAPELSGANSASVAENTSAVFYTATVTDNDSSPEQLSFALSGADSSWFSIDSSGGLAFVSAADYEAPQDADGDNTYQLSLRVTDETELYDQLELSVSVSNVNDAAPEFTSAAAVSVAENSGGVVHTIQASDAEGDTISYSLAGTDADSFSLDSSSGALSFFSPPNYEDAQDHDQDNTYELSIIATDGSNSTSQDLAITVTNSNEAPSFSTSSVSLATAENNASFVYIVEAASDEDSEQQLSYQLTGTDQSAFSLDASTLKLSFRAPPNYEAPSDQDTNNDYQISISASDGEYATSQDITISISDLNDEAPQFTSGSSLALAYANVTLGATIYTATSADLDANDATSYALSGAHAISFSLDPSSGELAFSQLPAQEDLPQDSGITYDLIITATDLNGNSADLDLSINLLETVGSIPEFAQASVNLSVAENTTASPYQAAATDADGETITYGLTGIDSSLFTIDSSSGELAFNSPPDYEQPLDSGLDNTYDLTITATDPVGNQGSQSLAIAITNLNDNSPQFDLTAYSFAIAENTSAVTIITASDADNDTLTLSLVVADDSSFFSLDSSSGALAFTSAPDFETAQDSNSDNTYDLELSVSDGSSTTTASISVTVTNVDEAPSFATDSQSVSISENASGSVYTATASDPEQANLIYSASGTDASLFTIGSSSGELSFKSIPDFETPLDQDADNIYQLDITASDASNSVSQALSITVANVNEPHSFASTSVSLGTSENNSSFTYIVEAADDPDSGSALTYQLSGDDQSAFNFDSSTHELNFKANPDYESPADLDSDNTYQISISAFDVDHSASQNITISVSDLNDEAPQFTSLGSQAVNYTTVQVGDIVYTATSTDLDAGDQVSYALSGADASSFSFDTSSGALAFAQLPSLSEFQSSNGGIAYALTITATDLANNSSALDLTINLVDDTGNAPVFTQSSVSINVDENSAGSVYQAQASDADGDPLVYSIDGTDAALFTIDSSSGELNFKTPPDFEQPADNGTDNIYDLTITATDPVGNQGSQSLAIAITNLNDNSPQFDLTAYSFAIAENTSAVTTITASDADNDTLTLSLVVADDSSFFSLDSSSGALAFISAPDFETAQDSNSDNTYDLELSVSDGSSTTTASISVTVTNVDEAPSFATDSQSLSISENASGSVYTATASDPEQTNLTYSASGTDASLFTIGSSSGELNFKTPPDFETPLDQGADNTYQLDITASDASHSVSQALSITVANVNEPHSFASTSVSLGTSENNSSFTYTVEAASDPDSGSALTYQLSGDDQSAFNFDSSTRELSFKANPDYESPTDQDDDNTYQISITAFDVDHSASQNITISVSDLNDEAPQFTSLGSQAVNYTTVQVGDIVYTATSTDLDAGDQVTYALTGADASHFTFDAIGGALAFAQLPSLSEFQSSNGGIAYALTITATDLANNSSALDLTINLVDDTGNAPVFTQSSVSINVDENSAGSVYQAQASDADGDPLVYSIDGTDAALFTIDSSSGELNFKTPPDFEQPADNGTDNIYDLTITATDAIGKQASQSLALTVTNVNEPHSFAAISVSLNTSENNSSFAYTVEAADDPDSGQALTYQLAGDDQSAFNFDSSTRELSFKANPDYESPTDQDDDNTYQISISAFDADHSASQDITISVSDLNDEAPQFTSLGSQAVNYTTVQVGDIVYTATSTDLDAGDQVSYALSGADASSFSFDTSSGALAFAQLPSLSEFQSSNGGIAYALSIAATDLANNSSALDLTINLVDDTGSAPVFTQSSVSINVDENSAGSVYQAQASDADGDPLVYSIDGTDAALFTIDSSSGELNFKTPPDFEQPADNGADNTYDLAITATDAIGKQASQSLAITVTNVNEAPSFASTSVNLNADENDLSFTHTVDAADDPDLGQVLTYQLAGDDAAEFNFDSTTRVLSFQQAPDFESPADQDIDNIYQIAITATDGDYSTTQAITIAVTNIEEAPYFHSTTSHVEVAEDPATEGLTSPVLALTIQAADDEDDLAGTSLNFVISGGADSDKFSLTAVDANSADLSFSISPDFDNPHDANLDSNYSLSIQVADSSGASEQHDLIVQVLGINDEVPQLTSAASADVNENSTAVFYTATATDADRSDWSDSDSSKHYQPNLDSITFSLDSANYPDSSFFSIDASSGELQASSGLDYEKPQSSAQSNSYSVAIEISDSAANSSVNIVTVSVIDDPNEPEPVAYSAPQIPWFYSDVSVGEAIDIPWVIYSGDGAIAWSLLVNGATVCSESASISAPVTSGVCSVSSSYLTAGSALNATAVSVTYSDSSSKLSEEVTFAYAASSAINFPTPSSNQDATACAGVDIGDPVNATSNSACYDYLLGDDDFGGPHDQVPSYLDPANGRDFEVIAYFIEWGIYSRDFHPADLPANLLSTALFSFVKLKGDDSTDPNCETCSFTGEVDLADGWAALSKSYATDAWCDINYDDWTADGACKGNGIFKQFWLLKQKFPHLKTCVSVGGWSFSRPFPLVGESATMRAIFADSIVDMAEKYHFDCIDIDWEFPIIGGGDYKVTDASGNPSYDYDLDGDTPFLAPSDNDAQYFANLIQELRTEIDSRGLAIDINSAMYSGDYGMSKMDYNLFAGNLHGIHMMTYDFYGAWDPYTGMQAALFPNSDPLSNEVALQYPSAYNNQHNIASAMARAVNNAIDNGFESNTKMRRKIVPGLAFYGRNYSGVSTTPVPGAYMVLANSPAEQLSWEQGNLNYVQLKGYYDHGETLHGNGNYDGGGYNTGGRSWTYNWDDESQTPFLYDSATQSFVSYTDPRGIFYQTCHAARENSKGVMFWEISGDSEDSQLVNAIHAALRGDTLSQYSDQPHCADIIGYGAASSDDDDS